MLSLWRLVNFVLAVHTTNATRIQKQEVKANDGVPFGYWTKYYKNMALLKKNGYQESFCGESNPECETIDDYPSPNSHVEMRWDDVNEQLQSVPARQRNGQIVRGNDLGFLVLNQYFWNDDGDYKTIGLGVSVEDHEFIRPFFDKIVGKEGRVSGYWDENEIREMAKTYLDGLDQFNSYTDVRPFITKVMHMIHVNITLSDADTQEFIDLQSELLLKIILPSAATGYGRTLKGARKTRAKFLNMYMDAMESDPRGVFEGLTGREAGGRLYLVAAGFMDSMLFAGGLSVASTIEVGLNALYSDKLPIEEEFRPLAEQDVEQFVYETLRLFPPVVGFPWWEPGYDGNMGGSTYTRRTVMNLAMASRDPKKWGSNSNKFVLRGLEKYKQLMPIAWALPANEILQDGKLGAMSRGCPGATLSVVVAKAFITEWINQQQASSSWILTSSKPITFSDATPFVGNYATFDKSYKVLSKEDVKHSCPALLKSSFNFITGRWLKYYQGEMNSLSSLLVGGLYDYLGGKFGKDDQTENMPACCSDKYTVAFYASALHFSIRSYTTRNQSSVQVPTKMKIADRLRIGSIDVPLDDIDGEPASDGIVDFNCIMDLLRDMPFNDWLVDKDHSNSWADLVDGVKFKTKKDWINSWYDYYTQGDGSPAMDPPKVDLRRHYFNVKADMWNDGLEKAMAFDMIGSHRVQPVSDSEADLPGSPKWVVKLNEYSKIKVRSHFGAYGADMYFDQQGMPVLIVTPERIENGVLIGGEMIENGDKKWQYWKFVWRSSLVGVITLVDHLYASHFRAANVLARGVREALVPTHPLRRLLSIFTFGTIDVNIGAMHTLVGVNHALHRTTPFKDFDSLSTAVPTQLRDPVVMHQHFLNDKAWESLEPKIQSTPYFQDGRVLFKAIADLVRGYADIIEERWCDEDGNLVDGEMKEFKNYLARLNDEGHFAGLTAEMDKCETMIDRLIATIWQVTGWHRHVGKVVEYIDPDLAAFSWKEGEAFGRPLQYLIVSVIGATTAMTQPKINEDYTHIFKGIGKENEAIALWHEFQNKLKDVQKTVQKNNADREIKNFDADPAEVECSIAV